MAYEEALKAAGAEVLAFDSFGSYQGDWLAKVLFQGEVRYVNGSYGSCSGCDAFEGEFGYDDDKCDEHKYTHDGASCELCKEKAVVYNKKLTDFGLSYLEDMKTKEELQATFREQSEWDMNATEILKWLEDN